MLHLNHHFSELGPEFCSQGQIKSLSGLKLSFFNKQLSEQLQIQLTDPQTLDILLGHKPIGNAISMVYAGHQFGGYSPQLGDGRGLLLGEVTDINGQLVDLHMKGAGPTPYSRRGDGRAVLRSSIREYLASEAMHHLGIASSRALALFDSNEMIYREQAEPAAMLLRCAKSHIRFGHFEYFFHKNKADQLDELIDYCLERYYQTTGTREENIILMLESIVDKTAKMLAQWQAVGFQHGVMNTDNMSILGETIDYGPYGFMESYDPAWVANHSDYEARYAFEKQPGVALWNLNCLLHCFSKHLTRSQLVSILSKYETKLMDYFQTLIRTKLGLKMSTDGDQELFTSLLLLLEKERVDYTCFWRNLSQMKSAADRSLILLDVDNKAAFEAWLEQYTLRRIKENNNWLAIRVEMLKINPKYIVRNYLAQQVIEAAQKGHYQLFADMMTVLQNPFDEHDSLNYLSIAADNQQQSVCVSCSS